jgi:hypothetical protein
MSNTKYSANTMSTADLRRFAQKFERPTTPEEALILRGAQVELASRQQDAADEAVAPSSPERRRALERASAPLETARVEIDIAARRLEELQ